MWTFRSFERVVAPTLPEYSASSVVIKEHFATRRTTLLAWPAERRVITCVYRVVKQPFRYVRLIYIYIRGCEPQHCNEEAVGPNKISSTRRRHTSPKAVDHAKFLRL